jgi:hypothetical protein
MAHFAPLSVRPWVQIYMFYYLGDSWLKKNTYQLTSAARSGGGRSPGRSGGGGGRRLGFRWIQPMQGRLFPEVNCTPIFRRPIRQNFHPYSLGHVQWRDTITVL